MKRILAITLCLSMFGISDACLLNKPPVITPTTAAAVTNALNALGTILASKGASPVVLALITDAQTAIAGDVSGKNWGGILRDLMTNLYSQLPLDIQNNTAVWAAMTAVEIALATIGA